MASFGFKTEANELVDKFVLDTDKRLNSENFVKNPFKGKIKKIDSLSNESYYGVSMKPIYPPFYYVGLLLIFIQLWFSNFTINLWMLPGTLIFLLGYFYSASFFYFMLGKGLRKVRYKGKLVRISKSEVITILLNKE